MRTAPRRSLLTGLGAAAALALAAPARAATAATTTVAVYLRATPSWSATRLLVIPSGATVSLTGVTSADWLQVTYGGQTGWVGTYYLKAVQAPAPAPAPVEPAADTDRTTLDVWLRATASWSAERLVVVPVGASVARTGTVSGDWVHVAWSGRTGWIHSAYLAPIVERAGTTNPLPRPTTALYQTFSYGTQSSAYHVWANGIDWSRATGVLWYLDGDYTNPAWSRVMNPTGTTMSAIAAEANRRNLVCVAVNTPDVYRSDVGYTWWYDRPRTAPYFRALAAQFNTTHGMDPSSQWMMGYSGGAQMISGSLMAEQQTAWGMTGGGTILVGGGGRPWTYSESGMASSYKGIRAHWIVGSLDGGGATVPATWSAVDFAIGGRQFFADRGYANTTLNVLPGVAHSYDLPGVMRAPLDAAGLVRLR